jgi:putative glutamine amidotransferase
MIDLSPSSEYPSIDVLLLDGGEDINPSRYGNESGNKHYNDERDRIETDLLGSYSYRKTRIAGICRGLQMINVYYGGNLIQDIQSILGVKHILQHDVNILKNLSVEHATTVDRPFRKFFDSDIIRVSSLHHQCVDMLAGNLIPTLICYHPDQDVYIIEGITDRDSGDIIRGIQSHPEFKQFPKTDGLLFSYLMFIDVFIEANQKSEKKSIDPKMNFDGFCKFNSISDSTTATTAYVRAAPSNKLDMIWDDYTRRRV